MKEASLAKPNSEPCGSCGHIDSSAPSHHVMLFHGHSNPALAEAVAKHLEIPLGRALVSRFSNGEIRVKIEENVRGSRVFVIQPTCGNVNDSLMELLIMIDALSRASAYSICAVIPYYGYAKQEKKTSGREPISAKLVANLITTAGADRVITVDLHAAAIQGFFDIPCDNLKALPIIVNHYRDLGLNRENVVVVSPDAGGVARATDLAEHLGAQLAIIFKRRPEPDQTQVIEIVGDIEGKDCIVVDDREFPSGRAGCYRYHSRFARSSENVQVKSSLLGSSARRGHQTHPLQSVGQRTFLITAAQSAQTSEVVQSIFYISAKIILTRRP